MRVEHQASTAAAVLLIGVASVAVASCGSTGQAADQSAVPPPAEVLVMAAAPETVAIHKEFAGQTYARDMVEIRGRVDGFVESRTFAIGADVKAGQVLYVLDRRPYEAAVGKARGDLAQAEADIAQAQANLAKSRQDVSRLEPLVQQEAATRQDLDDASAALQANEATVNARTATAEAARAQLRSATLNLEYATVRAPISGRIGDSTIQVGGLVSAASQVPLTTIVPLDPIWVRFKVQESLLPRFETGVARQLPTELILSDGTTYPHPGTIVNTLNQVDNTTGTMEVQVRFPNPDHRLLPGQFGRVRIRVQERGRVILVPQRAVQELQGLQSVMVVKPDHTVEPRSVILGERLGERWLVEKGLAPGELVIVEGLQKARPGSRVSPKAFTPPPATASTGAEMGK